MDGRFVNNYTLSIQSHNQFQPGRLIYLLPNNIDVLHSSNRIPNSYIDFSAYTKKNRIYKNKIEKQNIYITFNIILRFIDQKATYKRISEIC